MKIHWAAWPVRRVSIRCAKHNANRPQRTRVTLRGAEITGHPDAFREFLAAVEGRRPPASPPQDARRDLEIVLSAYTALRTDSRVAIP